MANKIFRYLLFMLRIRRVEFRIAEIPILAIPVLLLIRETSIVGTFAFWEGIFVFFLLFAFGDMINCLADRDLDAVYKPHLSESVYGLGVRFVTFQIVLSAILAVALSIHLSWLLNRWLIVGLTILGLLLGTAYSVKPVQLKGRGLLQLICLWTIIFVGPMFFVSQLVAADPSIMVLVFAAVYGMLQMGIILVNTAEDYPEDRAAGIRTTIVELGLHTGIRLALLITIFGSVGTLATLAVFYISVTTKAAWVVGILPAAGACFYVTAGIWRLNRAIADSALTESISTVKNSAKNVPVWITIVAWSMLWATGVLFYFR